MYLSVQALYPIYDVQQHMKLTFIIRNKYTKWQTC